MSGAREVAFWDADDCAETLTYAEPEEAARSWVDNVWPKPIEELPDKVTLYGFAPIKVDDTRREHDADRAVSAVVESLDDDLGDFVNGSSGLEPPYPDSVKAAARALVDEVLRSYRVWAHEVVAVSDFDLSDIKRELSS